jgi:hypothetical protein
MTDERRRLQPLRLDPPQQAAPVPGASAVPANDQRDIRAEIGPAQRAAGPSPGARRGRSGTLVAVILMLVGALAVGGAVIAWLVLRPDVPPTPSVAPSTRATPPPGTPATQIAPAAVGHTPAGAPRPPIEVVLFDPDRQHTRLLRRSSPSEDSRLLHMLFRSYLTDRKKCSDGAPSLSLDQQRAAGQVVPSIEGAVDGSFTAASTAETLYQVSVGECWASHAENWGTQMLVVLFNGEIVANAQLYGGSSIDGIFDLGEDGKADLFIVGGYAGQGTVAEQGRLVTFRDRSLVVIRDFGSIYNGNCASGSPPRTESFSIIRVLTEMGGPLEFRVEKKARACRPKVERNAAGGLF